MKNIAAFPKTTEECEDEKTGIVYTEAQDGMTLLDYFAGQALVGHATEAIGISTERVAELCYDMAESMLKEREERIK